MQKRDLNLSVRKMRAYKRAQRNLAENKALIEYYERLGTMDPDKIVTTLAKEMHKVLGDTSDTISRAAISKLKTLIPKSPRGRKPIHQST